MSSTLSQPVDQISAGLSINLLHPHSFDDDLTESASQKNQQQASGHTSWKKSLAIVTVVLSAMVLSSLGYYYKSSGNNSVFASLLAKIPSSSQENIKQALYQDNSQRENFNGADLKLFERDLNTNHTFAVKLKTLTDGLSEVWVEDTETSEMIFLQTLPQVSLDERSVQFANGNLFVKVTLDKNLPEEFGSDPDVRSELWVFPRGEKSAKKLFFSKDFEYLVNNQASLVAITQATTQDAVSLYQVDLDQEVQENPQDEAELRQVEVGELVKAYRMSDLVPDLGNQVLSFRPILWSTDGDILKGVAQSLVQTTYLIDINPEADEVVATPVNELRFMNDFALHPDREVFIYGHVSDPSVTIRGNAELQTKVKRELHFYNLETKEDQLVVEAETSAFNPRWKNYFDFSFETEKE